MNEPSVQDELEAFTTSYKPKFGPKCWTCNLPNDLLRVIDAGYLDGKPISTLVQFLVQKKSYPAREACRIRNHFSNRHHLGKQS